MPLDSRIALRLSFLMLIIGGILGELIMYEKTGLLSISAYRFLPIHIELLLIGWLFQLAIGVAIWMLPKFYGKRRKDRSASASILFLNLGVILTIIGFLTSFYPLVLSGRISEFAGGAAFVRHAWARVKPFGSVG